MYNAFILSLSILIFNIERPTLLLLRVAVVIKIHLSNVQSTEMIPLTNRCAILGSYGGLPWQLGEGILPVVHYGPIVVRNTQAIDGTMTVFIEIVLVF